MISEKEKQILDHLSKAHNLFNELPESYMNEIRDWVDALHNIQRVVMARIARRQHPDYFCSLLKVTENPDGTRKH